MRAKNHQNQNKAFCAIEFHRYERMPQQKLFFEHIEFMKADFNSQIK